MKHTCPRCIGDAKENENGIEVMDFIILLYFSLCLCAFVVRRDFHMKHTCPENKSGHKGE